MCIAIVNQPGTRLKEEWLTSSFINNPDGGGFAYIKEGAVAISKGWMTLAGFVDTYNHLFDKWGKDNPMLVHCRIATAGKVNEDNCHPFKIKGGALIHNGHLWSVDGGHNGIKSDTREFSEIFYNILNYDDVTKAVAEFDLADVIGSDKMAMLYDDGRYACVGDWQVEEGAMFSNRGYASSYGGCSNYSADDWEYHNYYNYARG